LPSTRPVIVLSSLSLCARAGSAARRRLLLVRASFATDRMIRHRSIRMIRAGPSVSVACCTTAA
jgi:hypothetical protein